MRVFLDVDGVLADFLGAALRVHGRVVDPWPAGEWDAYRVLGMTPAEFWAPLGGEFWAGLARTTDHADLLDIVERQFGREHICLLTAPPLDPDSLSGKARWIREHCPQYARQFLIGPAKHFVGGPRTLLIDDSDANVNAFRVAGGRAVLVPRRWNSLWKIADPVAWLAGVMAFHGRRAGA